MPIEDNDGLENEPKPAPKKKAVTEEEEEELVGQKRELWPLIPAIPVVIAIGLSLIPEGVDVNKSDIERARCVAQLRTVSVMKDKTTMEQELGEDSALSKGDQESILKMVACPAGGDIQVREVGREPRCALHGTLTDWLKEGENLGHWHEVTSQ